MTMKVYIGAEVQVEVIFSASLGPAGVLRRGISACDLTPSYQAIKSMVNLPRDDIGIYLYAAWAGTHVGKLNSRRRGVLQPW